MLIPLLLCVIDERSKGPGVQYHAQQLVWAIGNDTMGEGGPSLSISEPVETCNR